LSQINRSSGKTFGSIYKTKKEHKKKKEKKEKKKESKKERKRRRRIQEEKDLVRWMGYFRG
jgi:hypothetical protein